MADYYSQFSVGLDFPKKAADEFAEAIDALSDADLGRLPPYVVKALGYDGDQDGFEQWLDDNEVWGLGDLKIEYSHDSLFIWNDAMSVSEEAMTRVLSAVMKENGIREPAVIPVSFWCSKPRTDGFGGGVWVVGPDRIDYADTRTIGEKMAADMLKEGGSAKPKAPKM